MRPFIITAVMATTMLTAPLALQARMVNQAGDNGDINEHAQYPDKYPSGLRIFDTNGNEVATIDRWVTADDGSLLLVARVGNHLGIGTRDVLLRPGDLAPMAGAKGTQVMLSSDQIDALPDFQATRYTVSNGQHPPPTPHDAHGG